MKDAATMNTLHWDIWQGDVLARLRDMPDNCIDCVITSPPYWGLRDYGVAGMIGLESTFAEWLARMVDVFREVRRVLKPTGTCWVNMGDAAANDGKWGGKTGGKHAKGLHGDTRVGRNKRKSGLKAKDILGMPWRLAFALQEDGWYLRQDIIWSKPNPMPESVTDRCTKSHEYIFLLTKRPKYYYDQAAIAEPCSANTHARLAQDIEAQIGSARAHAGGKTNGNMKAVGGRKLAEVGSGIKNNESMNAAICLRVDRRNKRSVWVVPTAAFSEAHFATFPKELIRPMVKAGCPVGGKVLDPFAGTFTTGIVALEEGRHAVGIELNPEYIGIAVRRLEREVPSDMLRTVTRGVVMPVAAAARPGCV